MKHRKFHAVTLFESVFATRGKVGYVFNGVGFLYAHGEFEIEPAALARLHYRLELYLFAALGYPAPSAQFAVLFYKRKRTRIAALVNRALSRTDTVARELVFVCYSRCHYVAARSFGGFVGGTVARIIVQSALLVEHNRRNVIPIAAHRSPHRKLSVFGCGSYVFHSVFVKAFLAARNGASSRLAVQ